MLLTVRYAAIVKKWQIQSISTEIIIQHNLPGQKKCTEVIQLNWFVFSTERDVRWLLTELYIVKKNKPKKKKKKKNQTLCRALLAL